MNRRSRLLVAVMLIAAVVLIASRAWAHVTINPDEAEQGGFGAFSFRVPNERDDSGTTALTIEFPADDPIPFVSVKPNPGWTATVERTPLPEPVEGEEGEEITEAVSRITWTGGRIGPGEFDEFDVSMGPLPETAELVFNALQTYESGEVVRWIEPTPPGGPEPEFPAPVLRLVEGEGEHGGGGGEDEPENAEAAEGEGDDDDSGDTLAVVALIVGGLGLVAGVAGIVLGTRRRTA